MAIVHPLERAWITAGHTGAQNYDEFASDREITEIIQANPRSALAIEMPHCTPESAGASFSDALPDAVARLRQAQAEGWYTPAEQVVVLYRIRSGAGTAYGLFCLVDTDQISTSVDQPGLVIRNEDVFPLKVRERVALAEATGHLLSPVLLLASGQRPGSGQELHDALVTATDAAGPPAATDIDHQGRRHEIWPVPAGPTADRLCALAGGGELVVADGNHRTLAAQTGGLERFLAVVTTPASVRIAGYNRLVTHLPHAPVRGGTLAGHPEMPVRPLAGDPATPPRGVVHLYLDGEFVAVPLPATPGAPLVDQLDHTRVELLLVQDAFGLDPDDKRVVYVGGDYPVSWLRAQVDSGRAAVAIIIAPVSTEDFIAVNLARQKMPRKSTWFTPKARAGLVLAELV